MDVDSKKRIRCEGYILNVTMSESSCLEGMYMQVWNRTGIGLRVWLLGSHQQTEDNGSQHKEWDWGGVGTVCVEETVGRCCGPGEQCSLMGWRKKIHPRSLRKKCQWEKSQKKGDAIGANKGKLECEGEKGLQEEMLRRRQGSWTQS